MSHKPTIETRVELIEKGLKDVTQLVQDIRNEMRADLRAIAQELSTKARPFPIREVSTAVAVTITLATAFVTAANWWYQAQSATTHQSLLRLERIIAAEHEPLMRSFPLLKYRVDQIERKLRQASPLF
jgi:hypothetical protein